MTGIKIPVSADFDGADAEKTIKKLSDQLNGLAKSVASANKIQFNPVGQGTIGDLKKVEAQFRELTKISGALRERLKATGQSGASFGGLDWNRLYEDPSIRRRKMEQAYRHVTAGTQFAVGSGRGGGGGSDDPPRGPTMGGTAASVVGAGFRAAGPVGGVIANAGAAGMSGGLGAGMMGLLGGLAALAVGKGVAAVKDKVDAAGQEGIGYDTLKRTLGDVNVSFNLLRNSLRDASDRIDVTFEQSQKLGTDFAKLAGISKVQYKTLADEVAIGGGFGRSFGMDPSESNQFFAQMRGFKVTDDTAGSRKLAVMIGEAVSKSGSSAKADELLSAIASFTANQARNGLAAPNVAGYSGLLAGMVGSGIAGLDPQGAAALLGRVNGAISGGGASGEAGQNFLFNVLGSKHGLDPVQAMLLQQQGAFGTGRGAFGSKLYKQFTAKFGGGVSGSAASSDETNLSAILSGIRDRTNGNSSLMLNATARTLGINETQAMALHTIGAKDLNGMTGRMGRLGLDLSKLSSTGISALSSIEGGDLRGQAAALRRHRNSLSGDELARLKDAENSGDPEQLKDILTELTYTREQESTEGSKTRESIQGVEKRIQELATHLVGPMNTMRDALVLMAGGGKKGATGIAISAAEADATEKIDGIKSRYAFDAKGQQEIMDANGLRAQERFAAESRGRERNMIAPADVEAERQRRSKGLAAMQANHQQAQDRLGGLRAQMQADTASAEAERDKNIGRIRGASGSASTATKAAFEEKYGAAAQRVGKELGVDPALILGKWGHETGWGKSIIPGTNNLGNIKDFSGGGVAARDNMTGSVDRYRKFASIDEFADYDAKYIRRRFPNAVGAGSDGQQFVDGMRGYAEDANWGRGVINSSRGLFSRSKSDIPFDAGSRMGLPFTPIPGGLNPMFSSPEDQKILFEGNFTLSRENGTRAADPLVVSSVVRKPVANGASR